MRALLEAHGGQSLKPVFDELGGAIDCGRIKIAVAFLKIEAAARRGKTL